MPRGPRIQTRRSLLRAGAAVMAGGVTAAGRTSASGEPIPSDDIEWDGDLPEDAQRLQDGRVAIPLKRPSPSWLTEEIKEKTAEAAASGLAYDVENDVRVPPTQYDAIRPGNWMVSPRWCTLNFVFEDKTRIGIAGHCANVGHKVTIVIAPDVLLEIGEVKKHRAKGIGCDWGLVDVTSFKHLVKRPTAIVGGPNEPDQASSGNIAAKYIGHGAGTGTGGTPRTGIYTDNRDLNPVTIPDDNCSKKAFLAVGASTPGDSGAPVLSTGPPLTGRSKPIGILTHVIIGAHSEAIAGTQIDTVPATVDPAGWDITNLI